MKQAFLLLIAFCCLSACAKQDVIDSVAAGMQKSCAASRNCTVTDKNQTP
jgi:hypothetical protein